MPRLSELSPLRAALATAFALIVLGPDAVAARDVSAGTVVLTGHDLTVEQVAAVARHDAAVEIAPEAMEQVEKAFRVVLAAAQQDMPIYGLNRGVGAARQISVLEGDIINPEVQKLSEDFNRSMLISHSGAVGPEAPRSIVRAAMVARLNIALVGATGFRPEVVEMYAALLNEGITPVMPLRGSIGEADIITLPYIGLAMMGIGDVDYQGERIPAAEALQAAGLEPLKPFGKDGLGILSSNAHAAGMAALVVADAEALLEDANAVFALSLEALNGNVAPLLPASIALRPYAGHGTVAAEVRDLLEGSYLWQPAEGRYLQDPLSFRDTTQLHGAVREELDALRAHLHIQLNAADDNPSVAVDVTPPEDASPQERQYYVSGTVMGEETAGAIFPTAHFEPIVWVLDMQSLGTALSHLSNHSMQRSNRLSSGDFTDVELGESEGDAGFFGFWKTADALQTEIEALTLPVSVRVLPSASDIEDVGTNSSFVVRRVGEIVDLSYRILGMEFLMSGQFVDLRRRGDPDLALGAGTAPLLEELRGEVPLLAPDRVRSGDLAAVYELLRGDMAQSDAHGFLLR